MAGYARFVFDMRNVDITLRPLETYQKNFTLSFDSALPFTSGDAAYYIAAYPPCDIFDDLGECLNPVPNLCPYLALSPASNSESTEKGFDKNPFGFPAGGLLNRPDDESDGWEVDISSPCFEGECPAGYNPTVSGTPLGPELRGKVFKCNLEVVSDEIPPIIGLLDKYLGGGLLLADDLSSTIEISTVLTGVLPECTESCFSNVLFLPGIKASRLYENSGGEEKLWEPGSNSDVAGLYLNQDGSSVNQNIYTRDIITEVSITSTDIYKVFSERLDQLVSDQKTSEWIAFAYDWRESVEDIVNSGTSYENGKKSLVQTLQDLSDTSKSGKVTIVAHSNGGLLAKTLLKKLQDEKDEGVSDLIDKVDTLILVASPQIGTAKTVPTLLHGYGESVLGGLLISSSTAREFGRNMPAAYGLLPTKEYINRISASPVTFVDNLIPSGATTDMVRTFGPALDSYSEYKDFLFGAEGRINPNPLETNLPIILSNNLFSGAENLHDNLDNWNPTQSLRIIEIAGWGLDTLASFEYYPRMDCSGSFPCSFVLDERPRFTADGDGTVVVPSAQYMSFNGNAEKYWFNIVDYNNDSSKNYEHKNILEIDPLLDFISDTITGIPTSPPYLVTTEPNDTQNRFRISIHSPVTIDAYDSDGNHTGKTCEHDSDFCQIEENIPNSSYLEFGEGKYLNLPKEGIEKIVIKGSGVGTFTYESEEVEPDGTTTTTTFEDIPVTTETVGKVKVNEDSSLALTLDQNGDGTVDEILEAAPGSTVTIDITPPELQVTFDVNSKDVIFSALDTQDPNPNIVKTSTSITLTDSAGNTTEIPFTKLREVSTRLRLAYNKIVRNGVTTLLPNTNIIYDWKEKNGVLTDLDTRVIKKGVERNIFNYRKASNTTVIREKTSGNKVLVSTKSGFVVVTIQTESDGLNVSY